MPPVAAEFVTSVAAGHTVPSGPLPVIALLGRSNVGKSSLINALVKRRIARPGAKPGTTRLLNLYKVSMPPRGMKPFLFVDLPGYGYARGGLETRQTFDDMTRGFFAQVDGDRSHADGAVWLAGLLLVIDIRHPGLEADLAALAWAVEHRYPVVAVVTKADRVSRAVRLRSMRAHREALGEPERHVVLVSSRTGDGVRQVWAELKQLL